MSVVTDTVLRRNGLKSKEKKKEKKKGKKKIKKLSPALVTGWKSAL
jgi:hypothetical protein